MLFAGSVELLNPVAGLTATAGIMRECCGGSKGGETGALPCLVTVRQIGHIKSYIRERYKRSLMYDFFV